jgi:hypothetical protein
MAARVRAALQVRTHETHPFISCWSCTGERCPIAIASPASQGRAGWHEFIGAFVSLRMELIFPGTGFDLSISKVIRKKLADKVLLSLSTNPW